MPYGRRQTRGTSAQDAYDMAVARASGHAAWCVSHDAPQVYAVQSLHQITTDPIALAHAAAIAARGGYWRGEPDWPLHRDAARYLHAAGADPEEMRERIREVWEARNERAEHARRPPLDERDLNAILADIQT